MSSNKFTAHVTLAGILLTSVLYLATATTAQTQESPVSPQAIQPSLPPAADSAGPLSPATSVPATRTQRRPRSIYRRHPIDDRVKELAMALGLDETQQSGVKAILERQQVQARKVQFDPTLSGANRNDRFRALQEDTMVRIRALLNSEQKKKYDPLNHGMQNAASSQADLDQWMKHHQQPIEQHAPPPQK
jgi:hypothetical protein